MAGRGASERASGGSIPVCEYSLSGSLWLSQLVSAPRHPASPFAPLLWRLAPSIPGVGALRLVVFLHHALSVGRPHGFGLLSLLCGGVIGDF